MNLVFARDTLMDEKVPSGSYISLTGHFDYLPKSSKQQSLKDFDHTICAVKLSHSVLDTFRFKEGGRLQMISLCLPEQPTSRMQMPAGRDPAFIQETGYESARIRPLPATCMRFACNFGNANGQGNQEPFLHKPQFAKYWRIYSENRGKLRIARNSFRAQAIVLNDLGDHWPVKRVARILSTNDCYVKQAFRQQLGMGLGAWIRKARMNQSHQWLADTSWPITRISTEVGYSTPGRFAAVFERHFGMRPSDYRKQCQ